MKNYEIEICSCLETLGFDEEGTPFVEADVRREWYDKLVPALEEVARKYKMDVRFVDAQGQRMCHHGWNGANFTMRGTGIGAFGHVVHWNEFCDAADLVWEEIDKWLDDNRAVTEEIDEVLNDSQK